MFGALNFRLRNRIFLKLFRKVGQGFNERLSDLAKSKRKMMTQSKGYISHIEFDGEADIFI